VVVGFLNIYSLSSGEMIQFDYLGIFFSSHFEASCLDFF